MCRIKVGRFSPLSKKASIFGLAPRCRAIKSNFFFAQAGHTRIGALSVTILEKICENLRRVVLPTLIRQVPRDEAVISGEHYQDPRRRYVSLFYHLKANMLTFVSFLPIWATFAGVALTYFDLLRPCSHRRCKGACGDRQGPTGYLAPGVQARRSAARED